MERADILSMKEEEWPQFMTKLSKILAGLGHLNILDYEHKKLRPCIKLQQYLKGNIEQINKERK